MFKNRVLTGWMIALINVCAISNIKNFPLLAEYGFSIISFLILASLFFFIPVALVSAELASTWPERGVYTWVSKAFGPRMGFLAVWLQWIENVIWYPTTLAFIAATLAYLIYPDLAQNKIYMIGTILFTFWIATWVNFLGMQVSGWISSLSALFGTIIPIAAMIFMGFIWFLKGLPMQITFSWQALVPDFSSINQLVLFSGILLSLCGLEMSAVHAKEVINPRVEYPKGILLSSILILLFSTLGSVTIASIVPRSEIEFASSSMGAFRHFFETFNMPWATPLIAAVTAFGALGMMSTWIVGPSRGLQATAEHGDLPPLFHKTNQHGMPTNILIAQAIIVTVLTSVFLLMPSVNSSYWILAALASLLYMMMYILMFASAVFLRYKAPDVERSYRVPCGNLGMWIACIFGIIGSSFGVIVSFFPPAQIDTGNLIVFESLLVGSTIVFCLIPFLIFALKKPHWHKK